MMGTKLAILFFSLVSPTCIQATCPAESVIAMYPQTASATTRNRVRRDYAIGRDILFGILGNPRSFPTAKIYLLHSASYGYAPAETLLGLMYQKGWGVTRNYTIATSFLQKAAIQRYAPADLLLGDMYAKGHGVGVDVNQARAFYERAMNNSQIGSLPFRAAKRSLGDLPAD